MISQFEPSGLQAPFDSAHVSWRRKIAEYLAETVDKKGLSTLVPFESSDSQLMSRILGSLSSKMIFRMVI
jgi:hypothetical protein